MTATARAPVYIRVRFRKLGAHYHCRIFSRQATQFTWALLGELVVTEDEWEGFRDTLKQQRWEFHDEDLTESGYRRLQEDQP